MIVLQAVGAESFDDVYPLLTHLGDRTMSRQDWRDMLFDYPWATGEPRGYAIVADGTIVGFLGTIFSTRVVQGRPERVCSFSSWVVKPEHRGASVLMMRRLLRDLAGCTVVGQTPIPTTIEVFRRLGFQTLETEQLFLPPVPSPGAIVRAARATFLADSEAIRARLGGAEAILFEELRSVGVLRFVLLCDGDRQCLLAARPVRRKKVRVADLLHIGDPEFFWRHRLLAHAAFLRAMGAVALLVDARFADAGPVGPALRVPRVRLYLPSRDDIVPADLDNLYSELMWLRG